jgi:hypothetical protein
MPLLEITQTRYVNASVRLTENIALQTNQYAAFSHAKDADDVVEQALAYVYAKDREFQEFLKTPQAQVVTPILRIRKGASSDAAEPPAKKPASAVQSPVQTPVSVAGLKA